MWRLILVTFGFLGFAFYELSGGADYAPVQNSFQARSADRVEQPVNVKVAVLEPQDSAEPDENVTRSATLSDLATASETTEDPNRFQITLASVNASDDYEPTTITKRTEPEAVGAAEKDIVAEPVAEAVTDTVIVTEVFSLETYSASLASSGAVMANEGQDVRQVIGNVVNMRAGPGTEFDKVGKLTKGTQVAVLDAPGNGWIMVDVMETGESGWMADWLVTASN